jgi:hypothetical protein
VAKIKFDKHHYEFSDYASRVAERTIYSDFVNREHPDNLGFGLIDRGGTRDDFDLGIDRILEVRCPDRIVEYTVQERFRRHPYARYRQLTATQVNLESDQKGDFEKLEADLYVYGYLDTDLSWIEAIVVDAKRLKRMHDDGIIPPSDRKLYKRKSQVIIAWDFDLLDQAGCILWHSRNL